VKKKLKFLSLSNSQGHICYKYFPIYLRNNVPKYKIPLNLF